MKVVSVDQMVIMMVNNKNYVGGKCGPDGDNDGW